jgi:hypothetical protein
MDILPTPVTSDNLMSLAKQIEEYLIDLDSPIKHQVQKLVSTAERSFANCDLLLNENRLLFEQNNEKMTRASARAREVGKAKIMSYEKIKEAEKIRDAKEEELAGGTRRTDNRKNLAPKPATRKRSRLDEADEGRREIEDWEWQDFCSVLQF